MSLGDTGISPSYKVPRYLAKIVFAAGAVSAGSQRLRCLVVGMKTASGTLTADGAPQKCTGDDEATTLGGARAQVTLMAYKALQVPSVELWMAAVSEPAAGTAATCTVLLAGTPGNGMLRFRIAGVAIYVNTSASQTIDDIGTALAAAFNAKTKHPANATYDTGTDTLTLTIANKGAGGRDWTLVFDPTDKPSTLTVTVTGSSTIDSKRTKFGAAASGAGAEDVTTLLTKLTTGRYARIAVGHNDATNAALWETHVNTKAAPASLNLEHLVFGHNGTLTNAQSLAQTTLNAFRGQVFHVRNSENHPAELAAAKAAIRSVTEQTSPVPDYDGLLLSMLAPQAEETDCLTDAEQDTALNNGVTPGITVNGEVRCVRSITTYCLNGSAQDERCLDIGDAVMTDYACLDLKSMYETEFRPANPLVGPDPAEGEDLPPSGVAYPKLWSSKAAERLQTYFDNGWLEERPVGIYAPQSTYNKVGKYIASETPLVVRRVQHRLDNVVRQTSNSA